MLSYEGRYRQPVFSAERLNTRLAEFPGYLCNACGASLSAALSKVCETLISGDEL